MTTAAAPSSGTREVALAAALQEFATFGYRRTSMEGVARRAGLARATLYLHWSTKEVLFRELVAGLHEQHLARMREVAAADGLALQERLVQVLRARYGEFVRLTSGVGTAGAAELYDSHDRVCGDIAAAAEERAAALLADLLRAAADRGELVLSRTGLSVAELRDVLLTLAHAAKGVDPVSATPSTYSERLRHSVSALVHGVGA